MYNANEAAKVAGKSRQAIIKAIESRRLRAQQQENGHYVIDPEELAKVYPISDQEEQSTHKAGKVEETSQAEEALQIEEIGQAKESGAVDDPAQQVETEQVDKAGRTDDPGQLKESGAVDKATQIGEAAHVKESDQLNTTPHAQRALQIEDAVQANEAGAVEEATQQVETEQADKASQTDDRGQTKELGAVGKATQIGEAVHVNETTHAQKALQIEDAVQANESGAVEEATQQVETEQADKASQTDDRGQTKEPGAVGKATQIGEAVHVNETTHAQKALQIEDAVQANESGAFEEATQQVAIEQADKASQTDDPVPVTQPDDASDITPFLKVELIHLRDQLADLNAELTQQREYSRGTSDRVGAQMERERAQFAEQFKDAVKAVLEQRSDLKNVDSGKEVAEVKLTGSPPETTSSDPDITAIRSNLDDICAAIERNETKAVASPGIFVRGLTSLALGWSVMSSGYIAGFWVQYGTAELVQYGQISYTALLNLLLAFWPF